MDITLLIKDSCAFCELAKQILQRLSAEFSFSTLLVDLGSHAGQKLAEQAGVLFAPGILIDGKPFSYGRPSERKLRRELERRLHATGVER